VKTSCLRLALSACLSAPILGVLSSYVAATELAPYFWTWGGGAVSSLMDAKQQTGLQSATIAFVTSGSGCTDDGSTLAMSDDIGTFITSGGNVIISFGGAAGTYVETACTDEDQLFSLVESIIQKLGTQRLDFDIEGPQLSNTDVTARRIRVLRRLQSKYPDLHVSLTLPVEPNGLPSAALDLIKSTIAGGVKIKIVNIMAMDYGSGTRDLGKVAIQSAEGTVEQLKSIYPSKTTAQLYSMMGITPMIGVNDDGTVFTMTDAHQVASYALQKGIGLLSFWALQRDQPGVSIDTSSGTQQGRFAYFGAFDVAAKSFPLDGGQK
jgi:hypothetical protein